MVFQATNLLKKLQESSGPDRSRQAEHLMRAGIISQDFVDLSQDSDLWSESVSCGMPYSFGGIYYVVA